MVERHYGFKTTVNPLYNDIRYNSKIRYNVNLVCTKISGSCFSSLIFPFYSTENHTFAYLFESPRRGDSNKYTKRMIHKKLFKSICYSCFIRVHIKFLYNSRGWSGGSMVLGKLPEPGRPTNLD